MLTLRLPSEAEATLTELAKRTGKTKSYYAKAAILAYLANIKKHEDWQPSGKTTLQACRESLQGDVEHMQDPFEFLDHLEFDVKKAN